MQIIDVPKLEKILAGITKNDFHTSKTSSFIGRTESKIIVISALSFNEFEREFNEDPDDVSDMNFVLGE